VVVGFVRPRDEHAQVPAAGPRPPAHLAHLATVAAGTTVVTTTDSTTKTTDSTTLGTASAAECGTGGLPRRKPQEVAPRFAFGVVDGARGADGGGQDGIAMLQLRGKLGGAV
jgi:hypothetical protein